MPLPDTTTQWPPTGWQPAYADYQVYDAWYSGDVDQLGTIYSATTNQTPSGLWGQIRRRFWGSPNPAQASQRPVKVHVPVASSIARMSASLLYSELPTCKFEDADYDATPAEDGTIPEKPTGTPAQMATERLQELLDDRAHTRLMESGEFTSAHGGSFARVTWDKEVSPDRPFLTIVPGDQAVPEFRYGHLMAVTFWTVLPSQEGTYRLLERHEPGTIEWGLYLSNQNGQLGLRVPLTEHEATAHLAKVVDADSSVETGSELLTAVYLPNVMPNSRSRKDPYAVNLGRSDFAQAIDLMDELDEVFTSWMRDIRLGKARIMVPKGLLTSMGPGNGTGFNTDQEIFTELGETIGSLNPTSNTGTARSFIDTYQPDIRWEEHAKTAAWILEQIYISCGYSASTFGEAGDTAMTATESTNREKLTTLTRSSKILSARPELAYLFAVLLDVDEFAFDGPGRPKGEFPSVEFPDAAAENPKVMAETLQLLAAADSASMYERVKMLHDDWDEEQILAEVQKIKDDAPGFLPGMWTSENPPAPTGPAPEVTGGDAAAV